MKAYLLPISAALALAACSASSTKTTLPGTTATVAKATTTLKIESAAPVAPAPYVPAAMTLADGVTISSASMVVKEVNFKGWEGEDHHDSQTETHASDDNTASTAPAFVAASDTTDSVDTHDRIDVKDAQTEADKVDFNGPYVIDLLTGTSTPALSAVKIPAGNYQRVEFKLDSIHTDSEPGAATAFAAGMTGASFEVAGQLMIDGTAHDFVLRDHRDEELKWVFPQPVSVSAAQVNALILQIPVSNWINGAVVQAMVDAYHAGDVTAPTGGTLVFTTENAHLGDLMEQNLSSEEGKVEHEAGH